METTMNIMDSNFNQNEKFENFENLEKDKRLMKMFENKYNKMVELYKDSSNSRYFLKNRKYYKYYIETISNLSFERLNFTAIQKCLYILYTKFNWSAGPCGVYTKLLFNVLFDAARSEDYSSDDKEDILYCENDILTYISAYINGKYKKISDITYGPNSFIISSSKRETDDVKQEVRTICIKNNTRFMVDFIHEYTKNENRKYHKAFTVNQGKMLEIIFNHFPSEQFESINSFNDKTFIRQVDYLIEWCERNNASKTIRTGLFLSFIDMYVFIQNKMDEEVYKRNFAVYDMIALKYEYLTGKLQAGIRVYNYSIYDNPPFEDKFLLKPQNMAHHNNGQDSVVKFVDFTDINNVYIRQIVKEMFWYDDSHEIKSRKKQYSFLTDILNDFFDGQYGEITEDCIPPVTVPMITEIKFKYASDKETKFESRINMLSYFLKYIERTKKIEIDESIWRLLQMNQRTKNAYKESYTREELQDIIRAFKTEYEGATGDKKHEYYLYYILINMFIINSFRISSLLNLKVDSLVTILDSRKENNKEYAFKVSTKTSGASEETISITMETKKLFDKAFEATKELRKNMKGTDKNYLFIYKQRNYKSVSKISKSVIAQYLQKICKKYGIRYLKFAGIRNSHMQSVSEVRFKNSDGENDETTIKYIEAISGHTIGVHTVNYDKLDITEFCQRFYNVEIGNIELKGRIGEKVDEVKERTVEQGAGYCSNEECTVEGNLRCLLCDKFVTTVSCIPEFENMVQEINEQIENEKIPHEKDFLYSKKELCVAYLEKLYERKRILMEEAEEAV